MMRSVRYVWAASLLTVASALWAAAAQEDFTITGTIANWPGGTAEVRAEQHNPAVPQVREEVATGTIADDGSFEIILPPVSKGLLQSRLERALARCEDVTVTPPTTRFSFGDLVVYRDGEAVADLSREPVHDGTWFLPMGSIAFVTLSYYSNDATLQANCAEVNNTIMDIEVAQGWNTLVWTVTETQPEESRWTEVASVGGGEDVPWVMTFRGRIGVRIEPNEEHSAVVTEVTPGSPAQQAGLLVGDVIVAVDGQDVRGKNASFLIRGEPGTPVTLGVTREGEPEPIRLEVTRASP